MSKTTQYVIIAILVIGFGIFTYQLIVLPSLLGERAKKAEIDFLVQKIITDSLQMQMTRKDSLYKEQIKSLESQRDSLLTASSVSLQAAREIGAAIKKSIKENEQKTSRIISLPAPQFSREMSKFPIDSGGR